MPLLKKLAPDRPPFHLIEVDTESDASVEAGAGTYTGMERRKS